MQATLDLNCDLGEGFPHDAELMPLITSANIACGGHAGDAATMKAAVALALQHGVAIGAHPGFADRENFGRTALTMAPIDAALMALQQIEALREIVEAQGATLRHVKLHGALYHMAATNHGLADSIVRAMVVMERKLILFVPAGSVLESVARTSGTLRVVNEVFADRTYQADGLLTPRSQPNALIADEETAVAQVLRMVRDGIVRATDGTNITMRTDTVSLHGDGPHAVDFARRLNRELRALGVGLKAPTAESA
ncbi:MAG: 5-oxoprolinase subunit PxpA [Opitutaceae bacterium]